MFLDLQCAFKQLEYSKTSNTQRKAGKAKKDT